MKCPVYIALAAVLCLAACGTPGAPRPPSLELPRPVSDLAATRQGEKVTLTWTAARETTDKQNIRQPGRVRICRGVNTAAMVECPQVAELPPAATPATRTAKPEQRSYTDVLPSQLQQQNPTASATYAVELLNARGRSAGLSNQVEVPLAPTEPPPSDISPQVTPDAVVIQASGQEPGLPSGLSASFHLYRRQEGEQVVDLGAEMSGCGPSNPPAPEARSAPCAYALTFHDRSFEWEKNYSYYIASVTTVASRSTAQIMGEPSTEVKVYTKDIFAPAAPAGLLAVASGVGQPPFIDLTWAPNTEPDLAGYNVYRQEEGRPGVKINTELLKAPVFRDGGVSSGHKYIYSVTAVDLRGNESAHSAEASESMP